MKIDFTVAEIHSLIFIKNQNGDWEIQVSVKKGQISKILHISADDLDCKGEDLVFTMLELQMEFTRAAMHKAFPEMPKPGPHKNN